MKKRVKKVDILKKELDDVHNQSGRKFLLPADIVKYAEEHPESLLHSRFEWNDKKAGPKYRLWQARQIIEEVYLKPDLRKFKNETVPVWISLKSDRNSTGGYRKLVEVLSDEDMRHQLLIDAFRDFEVWERKYKVLNELNDIIEAKRKIKMKLIE